MAKKSTNTKVRGVLLEADTLINGERLKRYGDPKLGFQHIAEQWTLFIMQRHRVDIEITPEDVCWMMADLKKVRQYAGADQDNIRDAAGYIGLIEKVLDGS